MLALWSLLARLVSGLAVAALVGSAAAPSAASYRAGGNPASGAVGRDLGAQSCAHALPTGAEFGVIATTAGRPYFASPCLASEYAWATSLPYRAEYYINLADPGHRSPHWGQGGPRSCHRGPKYGAGCAYDYGYEAAAAAWGYVAAVGPPGRGRWWLDVELDNTWGYSTAGVEANKQIIRGALDYLRHVRHVSAGIYTETSWWDFITDGSSEFSDTPVWGGGAGSRRNARANCRAHSITGGRALLAQWISNGVDRDIAC